MMDRENRVIFHVDVNSAFLSWSALKRLKEDPGSVDLRTIPSAVGGDVKTRHGIITAKSIPAKAYGVQTGEPVVKALQKCPQLVTVPPDFETYRAYSRSLMEILRRYTPVLQQMSVDEAFLDLSELLSPEDREGALALAGEIRATVYRELGFTVNVGISVNKLLAKMASDFQKPDRTHTLYPEEVPAKMWPLPIGSLYGCGQSTVRRLELLGIHTIGEAAGTDQTVLQSLLGERAGAHLWRNANGISSSAVHPEREQAKSISNERTLSEDVDGNNYEANGVPVIRKLAEKVALRMQKGGLEGRTVTFQVKTSDFRRYSRQLVLPEQTDRAEVIGEAALRLADQLLAGPEGLFASGNSVRLIGVGVSKLAGKQIHQMDLFEWADRKQEEEQEQEEARRSKERRDRLDAMLEKVNSRYGSGTLEKGTLFVYNGKSLQTGSGSDDSMRQGEGS